MKTNFRISLNKPDLILDFRKPVKKSKTKGIKLPPQDFRGKIFEGSIKILMENLIIHANLVDADFKKLGKEMIIKLSSKDLKVEIANLYKINGFGELSFSINENGKMNFRKIKIYSGNLLFSGRGRILIGQKLKYSFILIPQGELTQIQKTFLLPFVFEGIGNGEVKIFTDSRGEPKILITVFGENGKIGSWKIKSILSKIAISKNVLNFEVRTDKTKVIGKIKGKKMNLSLHNIYFSNFLKLYDYSLPFESLCNADISMNFKNNSLSGKAFCNDNFDTKELKLKGDIAFFYNVEKEILKVKSKRILSGEDTFSYSSIMNFKKERYEDLKFEGNFKSLTRYLSAILFFTDIDFTPWKPEADGKIRVEGKGKFLNPEININLNFNDLLSQGVYLGKFKSILFTKNKITKGNFTIEGSNYSGDGKIVADSKVSHIILNVKKADIEGINKILELDLPIKGSGEGSFDIKLYDKEDYDVSGKVKGKTFYYGNALFENYTANLKNRVKNKYGTFSLKELKADYNGGKIEGEFSLSFFNEKYDEFDVNIKGKGVQIKSFIPAFSGKLKFNIQGKGKFGKDSIKISGKSDKFKGISPLSYPLELKGSIVPFEDSLGLNFSASSENKKISARAKGILNWEDESLNINFFLNTKDINYILPWRYNVGALNVSLNVSGKYESPILNGFITAKGDTLVIPDYSQSINNFDILAIVRSNNIMLSRFKGILGGGEILGGGNIKLENTGVKSLNLRFHGKNLKLIPMERVKGIADANIELKKEGDSIKVGGIVHVKEMEWQREFEEGISFTSSPEPIGEQNDFMKIFNFDVNFVSEGNSWVRNSLFEGEIKYNFFVKGNYLNPIILGEIDVKKGFILFSDQKFNVLRGSIIFDNPYYLNPRLKITSESYIKDYRVNFKINGYYDHPIPELTSSPPLPPQEVLTLIAMGESYRRSYSSEIATMQSSSALIASSVKGIINSITPKKFRPDIIRVYPFMNASSSEPSPRIAVGNKISKNLFVIYTFDLTNQNNYMIYGEYTISKNISLIAYRDDNGYYSLEFRIVKRRQ